MRTSQGLWRNGRLLSEEEILGPDSPWRSVRACPSDSGAWLAATARHAETGTHYALRLLKMDIAVDNNRDGEVAFRIQTTLLSPSRIRFG